MNGIVNPLVDLVYSFLSNSTSLSAAMPFFERTSMAAQNTATCLSCSSPCSTDPCQTNTPGGLLLLTTFWDYNPATGPSDSWTIHGLWPDLCSGLYDSSCDASRDESDIATILQNGGAQSTLDYMNQYWVDINGDNGQFYSHECNKHGTCVSTLDPKCYPDYQSGQDIVDFFTTAVNLFQELPLYSALSQAGIIPSTSQTYTLSAMQAAAQQAFGQYPSFRCSGSNVNEAWFDFETTGRSTNASAFTLVAPLASNTNCPSTGIKYNPKSS